MYIHIIYIYMCIIFTYCPAFQGVAHILSDKAPAQATVRANQLASGCGNQNLSEVLASTADLSLASSEDITKSVVESERTCGPTLPSSRISMRKAALLGFQTWHTRAPGIGAVLLGRESKKGVVCYNIVVGKNGFGELFADEKVKAICTKQEISICGVIMAGHSNNEDHRKIALVGISSVLAQGSSLAACVMVTWSLAK